MQGVSGLREHADREDGMRDYDFGNFLRELRERRGLSQYQLGMLAGVSDKAVSKWENGSARPQSRILYGLGEILGVTVDELLACRYRPGKDIDGKETVKLKKEIWDRVYAEMKERYGEVLPVELSNRYFTEYEAMRDGDEILCFELLGQISRAAEEAGEHMRVKGGSAGTLAAFILGASEVNPLKPHYYCPVCRKIRFEKGALCGWDLPEEKCSCGRKYIRDGHDIPFGTLQPNLRRPCRCDVLLSRKLYRTAGDMILSRFRDMKEYGVVVLNKKDAANAKTFVIPDRGQPVCNEPEIAEFMGTERKEERTLPYETFYQRLKSFPMITLVESQELSQYRYLEEAAGIPFRKVPFTDREVLEPFRQTSESSAERSIKNNIEDSAESNTENRMEGIPEFESEFLRNMLREVSPGTFYELIQILGLAHGTGTWLENGQDLVGAGVPVSRLTAYREDVFRCVQEKIEERGGSGTGYACRVMEEVRRGIYARDGMPGEIRQQLFGLGVEEWLLDALEKIRYLFPRASGVASLKYELILMWYKIHYPEEFRGYVRLASSAGA